MINSDLLQDMDDQLNPAERELSSIHFQYELSTESSLFDLIDADEGMEGVLPHLVHSDRPIPFGEILKDWAIEQSKRKETYVYLLLAFMFIGVFSRITHVVIDEDKMAMVKMPEMMTPPPTPPPPKMDTPEMETPEPTPEATPEPTPKPIDKMEQQLDELDQAQQLEELDVEDLRTESANDLVDNRMDAVQDRDNSVGSINRRFARVTDQPQDSAGSADLSQLGRGVDGGDRSTGRQLGRVAPRRGPQDTSGQQQLGDLTGQRKKKPSQDGRNVGNVNWIKLPSIGPVAHLQPRCRGRSGYVVVGQYRLKCGNDQIQAAWIRQE